MADTRRKNVNWTIATNADGTVPHQDAQLAVLMDIRDAAQETNRRLDTIASSLGWSGYVARDLRGLRRDIKDLARAIFKRSRCRRAHVHGGARP